MSRIVRFFVVLMDAVFCLPVLVNAAVDLATGIFKTSRSDTGGRAGIYN